MIEFFAIFGFLAGMLACYQLNRLSKNNTIQIMESKIAQLRASVRALEAKAGVVSGSASSESP